MSKEKQADKPKLERSWALFKSSLAEYRAGWKPYVKILAVVAIPFNLLTVLNFAAVDLQTLSIYGSFASIIMNVALIWAILERAHERKPTVPGAYYTGVGQIVSYILTSALLVVMLIPLAIALVLYSAAATPNQGTTAGEIALVGAVAFVVAMPSIYLIIRFGFGLMLVMTDKLRPVAALRRARVLSLGHFWPITGRLLMLALFLLVLTIPAAIISAGLSFLHQDSWSVAVFQVITTLTLLPIAYIYALRLLRNLEQTPAPARAKYEDEK